MLSGKVTLVFAVALFGGALALPAKEPGFWKGAGMEGMVEEMRSGCSEGSDAMACIKFKLLSLLDSIFKKDIFQVTDSVEVTRNSFTTNEVSGRSEYSGDFFDSIESYLKQHDVTFTLPASTGKVTVSSRNLDGDELDLNIRFADAKDAAEERSAGAESRKSKLKKIMIPILVFVLLKAITVVPLAVGVIGLKAWNALQLSFFSFVVSVALAIFQLCKKIAADNSHPQIAAHGPWDAAPFATTNRLRRSIPKRSAQDLAYKSYL